MTQPEHWPTEWPQFKVVRAGAMRALWRQNPADGPASHVTWLVDPSEVVEVSEHLIKRTRYGQHNDPLPPPWPFCYVRLRRQTEPVLVLGSVAHVCALLELERSSVDP